MKNFKEKPIIVFKISKGYYRNECRMISYKSVKSMKKALTNFVNSDKFIAFYIYEMKQKVTDKLDLVTFLNKFQ